MKNKLILYFSILIFVSCSNREERDFNELCMRNTFLGRTQIEDESREYLKYEEGQKLVFKSVLGDSLIFSVTEVLNELRSTTETRPCELDREIEVDFVFEEELKQVTLENERKEITMYLTLNSEMNFARNGSSDNLLIAIVFPQYFGGFRSFFLDFSKSPPFYNYQNSSIETWNFNNKSYSNVLLDETRIESTIIELYYNREFGIVGFKDLERRTWTLEKII